MVGLMWVVVRGAIDFMAMGKAERASVKGRARWLQRCCQHCLRLLHVRTETTGDVAHGVLITPNHVSYLDIIVLGALAPTVFVAKAEVQGWPVFGWFARKAGTLFLRREVRSELARIGAELDPVLASGANLIVFLEGTSTDGTMVRAFKAGMLEPAVRAEWTVCPAGLSYRVPEGHDVRLEVAWWGTMPLASHLAGLLALEWIDVRVGWGRSRVAVGDRKAMAVELHAEVERLSRAVGANET
jgi:1-acyl-sn-glycerol-3-phosphate acyltransferase